MRAAIVAVGKGSRTGNFAMGLPKSLLPFGGRPLLAHQIDWLVAEGINEVTLLLGDGAEATERWVAKSLPAGCRAEIHIEKKRLGTGGCLRAIAKQAESWLVVLGDLMVGMDLRKMARFHSEHRGLGTLLVHPNDHPHDSDLVEMDGAHRIFRIHRKPHPPGLAIANRVAAGIFLLQSELLERIPEGSEVDLIHDLLFSALDEGAPLHGYSTPEYIKDIGTPGRYREVALDWECGRVAALHSRNRRRTAFLDRDGTINRHVGFITKPAQIDLLPTAARAIRRLNQQKILVVVVTNQSVISRGMCDEDGLKAIHGRLEMLLGEQGAYLDALFYCPHHPDSGYAGERPALKMNCGCRKPGTGMVERALRDLPIDLSVSAVFGDSSRDTELARQLGIRGFLIGEGETPADPAIPLFPDLASAVDTWLDRSGAGESV